MTASLVDLAVVALQARLPKRWVAARLRGGRLEVSRPYRVGDGMGARFSGSDADELVRLARRLDGTVS